MCIFFHQDRRSLRGSKGQICHIIKVKFQTTSNCQTNGVNINMQNYPRGSVFALPHWGPLLMAWSQRSIRSFDLLEKKQRQGPCHCDDTAISSLVFLNFVYNHMGISSTGTSSTGSTPTTIYILMHNSIMSYRAGFNLSLLNKCKKMSLIWCHTYLAMWSIFGVKLNYIVLFEESCNTSTLLMEVSMICGYEPIRVGDRACVVAHEAKQNTIMFWWWA